MNIPVSVLTALEECRPAVELLMERVRSGKSKYSTVTDPTALDWYYRWSQFYPTMADQTEEDFLKNTSVELVVKRDRMVHRTMLKEIPPSVRMVILKNRG